MCDLAKAESYAEALEDVGVIVHCALDATAPQKTDAIVVDAINAACRAEPGKTVIMLSSIWYVITLLTLLCPPPFPCRLPLPRVLSAGATAGPGAVLRMMISYLC